MTVEVFLTELSPEPTIQPAASTKGGSLRRFLLDILETFGLAIILFLVINTVSARVRVDGNSMLPTLQNNQYVLVNRLVRTYQRGDIIVFRPPMYPQENFLRRLLGQPSYYEDYIKRIIGLPGDTVEVNDGIVSINGVPLEETYIADPPAYSGSWRVPQGYLFVMGDNRNNSSDSHSWGYLPVENVLGKAILVYWPFADWNILHTPAAMAAH